MAKSASSDYWDGVFDGVRHAVWEDGEPSSKSKLYMEGYGVGTKAYKDCGTRHREYVRVAIDEFDNEGTSFWSTAAVIMAARAEAGD